MTVTGKETETQLPKTGFLNLVQDRVPLLFWSALQSQAGSQELLPSRLSASHLAAGALELQTVYRAWRYLGVGSMRDLGVHNEVLSLVQQALPPLSHLPSPRLNFSSISFGLWFAIIRKIIKLSYMMLSSAF